MRIGLFGGSFNPIHNGHVILGKTMLKAMKLDEVWFVVSPQNPLKVNADLLEQEKRLMMVGKALEKEKALKASDYEFNLPKPSYTWNTLMNLKKDYPTDDFVLIIGGDNWTHFDKWAHHDDILREYEIAVFPRENEMIDKTALPENVTLVDVPLVNVTSTMLRAMIREGKNVEEYVPKEVLGLATGWYKL